MGSDFHFLSPLWFLALLPLGLLLSAAAVGKGGTDPWRRVVDERLLAVLRAGAGAGVVPRRPLALLAAGWIVAVVALANPTFERKPVPAFRTDAARIVALDLSRSMLVDDIAPTRLQRARYKVADILNRSRDGQAGLVVFSGDAFPLAPLTDDADSLLLMLDVLAPDIMPVPGSRPDLAIATARALLEQAGARNGEVVLLTDDAGGPRAASAAEALREAGHRLSVIGVGTEDGGAVPGVRTSTGSVIAELDERSLRRLAREGGGDYARLSTDDADLDRVLQAPGAAGRLAEGAQMQAEAWRELGPWIALLLLPLGALAFRRGWLVGVLLLAGQAATLAPQPALAFGWSDLWQRRDQQAAQALQAGDYERARALAEDTARAGAASYRLGDYEAAEDAFASEEGAVGHYNRGNALARAERLREAIGAYEQALALDPDFDDARYNKEQVEKALEQPPEQEQQQQQSQGDSGDSPQNAASEGESGESNSPRAGSDDRDDESGEDAADGERGDTDQAGGGESPGQADPDAAGQQDPEGTADSAGAGQQDDGRADAGNEDPAQDSSQDPARQAQAEQAARDYREEAAETRAGDADPEDDGRPSPETRPEAGATTDSAPTPEEQESRQAAEQWLRRVPDDPAGLLRRKFLYQYRARAPEASDIGSDQPW